MLRNTEVCSAKLKVIVTYLPGLVLASFFFFHFSIVSDGCYSIQFIKCVRGSKSTQPESVYEENTRQPDI